MFVYNILEYCINEIVISYPCLNLTPPSFGSS